MPHNVEIHQAQTSILRELLFRPDASFTELRKPTGLESDHFKFHIAKLVELGFVEKSSRGRYRLTSAGKEHANKLDTDSNTIERQPKTTVLLLIQDPDNADKYLFQQRKKHPYFDYWGLPSGKIRWGETIHQAASRELHEETGLRADTSFIGLYHELTSGEDGELMEDKIFFVFRCTNCKGQLKREFDGGINGFYTPAEARYFDKKYATFGFELELALREAHDHVLVERQVSYTKSEF